MTKDEMIEELLEYQLQSVPALELIQMYIQLTRAAVILLITGFLLEELEEHSDDVIAYKYKQAYGNEEALH